MFNNMNIYLNFIKAFLNYSLMYLLNQYIDILKLNTVENKLIAIQNLKFPRILTNLKRYLDITSYSK